MHTVAPSSLLKFAFAADAAVSGAVALLQLLAPDQLTQWTALPRVLLVESGLFLVGYALLLAILARSRSVPRALVLFLIIGNIGWAGGCLLVITASTANGLGVAFSLIQAVTVLLFAGLQTAGLKSSQPNAGLKVQGAL